MAESKPLSQVVAEDLQLHYINAERAVARAEEELAAAERGDSSYTTIRTYTENLRQAKTQVERCLNAYTSAVRGMVRAERS